MNTTLSTLLILAVGAQQASATVIDWSATAATTAWATGTNWGGGTAPSNDLTTDIARFNQTAYATQPNAGTTSINGIQIGDGSTATATLTLAGTALSIGDGGITKFFNSGLATISSPVKLGASQSWANNSNTLLTVSGTVTNVANTTPFTLTLNGSGVGGTAISGIISNGGTTGTTALTVNTTAGSTILSASNTYTGATTITSGTLQIGSGSTTGKLAVTGTIANNGVLIFNRSNAVTQGTDFSTAAITGSGQVIQNGTGTLTLNAANSYSGGTTVNSGLLQLNAGAVPSGGLITINSAGALNSTGAFTTVTDWLGSGKIDTDSSGAIALTGNSAENIAFTGYGDLMLGAGTAATYSGTLTAAGTTYRLGGGGGTLTVSSDLNSTGNALVVGATGSTGTVVLTAANTYTGATTLNGGALSLFGATGSSASSAITAQSGTTLNFDSSTAGVTGATRASAVTLKGAALSVLGNSTANSNDTITGALTVDNVSTYGVAGANTVTITPNAATHAQLTADSLVRANQGAVFFRGTNLGVNTIASATLNTSNIVFTTAPTSQLIGGGGAAGSQNISILPWAVGATSASGVPSSFVTYDANGIRPLDAGEYDTTIPAAASTNNVKLSAASPVTANGATTINSLFLSNAASSVTVLAGTGALTVTSGAIYADFSLGGNSDALTVSKQIDFGTAQGVIGTMGTANSKTLSFTGGISGSGGLMVYDTGTTSSTQAGVNIGAATTYTGNTIINGSLIASTTNALPNFTNGSRTGDVYVNGTLGLSNNNSTVQINGLWGNGRIITPFSNSTTLVVGDNNATSTFDGLITQTTGTVTMRKIGTGTLTLTGTSNTHTGATNIQNGTLSAVTLNSVAAPNTTSSLGRPVTIANGTIGLGSTTTTGTLKVVGTGETTDRVINLAGTTGGGAIDQSGTGLLKFTGNFTATGNGLKTLTLTGSTAGTGEIAGAIVNSTSATSVTKNGTGTWTLSGANTYTGATTVNAGTLALGANNAFSSGSAIGLTAGTVDLKTFSTSAASLDFAAGSTLRFDLTTPGNSTALLALSGSLAKTNTGVFTLDFSGSGQAGTYNLVSFSGTTFSDQNEFTVANLGGGLTGSLSLGANSLSLVVSAVPEPSTYALLAGAGTLLCAFVRRKIRTARTG